MKRFLLLALSLSLTAASCNLLGGVGGSGVKGVLKSEDAGKNFVAVNKLAPKGTINSLSSNVFVMDPKNADTMYIGATGGIFKTKDAGANWTQVLTGINVSDIAPDPNQSDVIYAVGLAGRNGKIIRSSDGGSTWTDLYTEPSSSNPVLSVALSPVNSRIILAGLATGEIIRSTDEGKTWQPATDLQDKFVQIRFYSSSVIYALTLTKGLFKSIDQGSNWTALSMPELDLPTQTIISSAAVRRYLDVAFDTKLAGVIFLATDQGLIRSIDGGNTWALIYLPLRNTTLQVTAVGINPTDSNNLYTAVGSTMFKSTNGGVTWETDKLPSGQTVRHILINPTTPNIIYLGMGDRK